MAEALDLGRNLERGVFRRKIGRAGAGLAGGSCFHPNDERLGLGTPGFHPNDGRLSLGTPGLRLGAESVKAAESQDLLVENLAELPGRKVSDGFEAGQGLRVCNFPDNFQGKFFFQARDGAVGDAAGIVERSRAGLW